MTLADDRLAAWRAALSPAADESRLARRLRFLGWSREDASSRMAGDHLFSPPEDRGGAALLQRALDCFESRGAGPSQDGTPFAEIFGVFSSASLGGLHSGAEFFQSCLALHLGEIAAPALLTELRAGVTGNVAASPADQYRIFLRDMQAGGLRTLLTRLPVLSRLLAFAMRDMRDTAGEFLARVDEDRDLLAASFPGAAGEIVGVDPALGDAHRGGRRVMAVTFAGGRKIIYKPRGLRMDVTWHRLLGWLRDRDSRCMLQAPLAIDRGDYGWVEFVEPGQPDDPAEYYRCAGELLALAWLCGGSDFHEENLVATPRGPVLIDLETLFTPFVRPFGASDALLAEASEESLFRGGVLSTLLLPVWEVDERGNARDQGGLTGRQREGVSWREPKWVESGTSRMRQEMLPAPGRQPHNIPRDAAGRLISATGFIPEILDGFRTAAHTLLSQRDNLPLEDFRGAEIRFLVRHTQIYGSMSLRLRGPKFLAGAVDRSIELEKLSRPFFPLDVSLPEPEVFGCYEAERRGIENGDIPVFHARTDETTLHGDGGIGVRGYFWKSGWDVAQERLRLLDEAAITEQAALVRSSLQLRFPDAASFPGRDPVSAAVEIAEDIAARTVPLRIGGVAWLSLGFDPVRKMQSASVTGLDLYSGSSGVAIFLAALARVTGEARWKKLAIESTRPGLDYMRRRTSRALLLHMPLGLGSGLGSLLYSSQTLAHLLADESYLDDAAFFAGLIRERVTDVGDVHDVLGGAAGAILAMLNLHEETGDVPLLETALALGHAMLAARMTTTDGHRVWKPPFADFALTGLGHGAAGFALALDRLGAATGEWQFTDAAAEAIVYEREVFDSAAANWPDFRRNTPKVDGKAFMHGWCSGGPGIGLARLAHPGDHDAFSRSEIDVAIQDARFGPTLQAAHLCCGQCARIELLLTASRAEGNDSLREEAAAQAFRLIEERRSFGFFPLNGADHGRLFAPSFFQGLSGIGYTFLRLIDETLPSVATFETGFNPEA